MVHGCYIQLFLKLHFFVRYGVLLLGASVNVVFSDNNMLQGIFFQDEEMKQAFLAFPELLCIDATYKLLELRFPLYIILIEDGNGHSEVAAEFLLLEESKTSITFAANVVKENHPEWKSVRVIMADKT